MVLTFKHFYSQCLPCAGQQPFILLYSERFGGFFSVFENPFVPVESCKQFFPFFGGGVQGKLVYSCNYTVSQSCSINPMHTVIRLQLKASLNVHNVRPAKASIRFHVGQSRTEIEA